jgi:hypothetical protein
MGVVRGALIIVVAGCSFTHGRVSDRDAAAVPDAEAEADAAHDAGTSEDAAPARVTQDLVALYTFEEGSGTAVIDRSGFGIALDLVIPDPTRVTWGNGTLTVTAATLVASPQAATKVLDACRGADAVTLEAWLTPAAIAGGYPRVASLASTNSDLAITLMAINDHLEFRMRGPMTDSNGLPSLNSPAGSVTVARMHVALVSEAGGTRRLYIDAVERATDQRGGDLSAWGAGHRVGLASELDGTGPWLGTYDLVAIYARALTADEVGANFAAGPR